MNSREIKAGAKEILKSRFSLAIVMSLAIAAISVLVSVITDSALVFSGLVDYETGEYVITDLGRKVPVVGAVMLFALMIDAFFAFVLGLGVKRWFFALCHNKYLPLDSLFYGYKKEKFKSSVSLSLRLLLRETGWGILLCVPGLVISATGLILLDGAKSDYVTDSVFTTVYLLGILIFAAGSVGAAVVCLRYFLAPYIIVSAKNVTPKEAIKISVSVMKSNTIDLVRLYLSFIPLILLAIVTFGLTLIYTVPLMNTSLALFAKGIMKSNFSREEARRD